MIARPSIVPYITLRAGAGELPPAVVLHGRIDGAMASSGNRPVSADNSPGAEGQ
ncbi:hypothetical protein [Streptomyces luteireticuli]|uniref:Alpha/beta hydrolase n=1 Tax=Streptomyces luteireticuli TaxID=173858 RepID=A0ABN0Z8V4_9ACTN